MRLVWGKLLGALYGTKYGLLGVVIGLVAGHIFDLHLRNFLFPNRKKSLISKIFFTSTFHVMGHIAKADGRVSESELNIARKIMRNDMLLDDAQSKLAMGYFTEGKQAWFNLKDSLCKLRSACSNKPDLLLFFLELQVKAAMADGQVHSAQRAILVYICAELGISISELDYKLRAAKYGEQKYYPKQEQATELSMAYEILGISKDADERIIKKAYRRLMSQHHPDKLVSKGLPPEMIKMAQEKTQKISAAYELIMRSKD